MGRGSPGDLSEDLRSVSIVAVVKTADTVMLPDKNRITTTMLVKGLILFLHW
jgi:hypothetical protein